MTHHITRNYRIELLWFSVMRFLRTIHNDWGTVDTALIDVQDLRTPDTSEHATRMTSPRGCVLLASVSRPNVWGPIYLKTDGYVVPPDVFTSQECLKTVNRIVAIRLLGGYRQQHPAMRTTPTSQREKGYAHRYTTLLHEEIEKISSSNSQYQNKHDLVSGDATTRVIREAPSSERDAFTPPTVGDMVPPPFTFGSDTRDVFRVVAVRETTAGARHRIWRVAIFSERLMKVMNDPQFVPPDTRRYMIRLATKSLLDEPV